MRLSPAISLLSLVFGMGMQTSFAMTGEARRAPALKTTRLELTAVDDRGEPIPSRMLVRPETGACVVPEGAVDLRIGRDRWFMSSGKSVVRVPPGRVEVRVERGLEYSRYKKPLVVAGARMTKRVTLKRWVDMKSRGYLCAENHLHVAADRLAAMLVAEGLDFGTSLTWWNGPDARRPVPPGEGRVRALRYAGRTVPTSVYDAELEYGWGAAYITNLPARMPFKADRGRPNLDYLKHAVQAGALVHYQGGWSREVALDALLGVVHTVNVCNNNFHLHRFQPRSRYSNLLAVDGFPVYPDTERGMMRMNTDTYYRLLNWGLRLAAGAGSATGVKQVPVGYNRAYVRVRSGASLDAFNKAWAAGKNFVTNGPMLFMKTSAGQRPGDTINLPAAGGRVRVQLEVLADQSLTAVEVLVNGDVVHSATITDPHRVTTETDVEITKGSWIAARCTARDDLLSDAELARYVNANQQHPSRLRFAHTSPVYVTLGGKFAAVEQSLDEGRRMLDRFEAFARRQAKPEYLRDILKAVDEAREKLSKEKPARDG